ncbi:nucleoside 2-deoxyribosyltransferase [Acidomonas methanolica]|uniref:nucleoside 2-deoxyribosyltransferase n=1 Tax=Acidomonas methanolica TaxID=437 RepID=UPI00211A1D0F|nr:nucleoside 2-deoxyribosyltransferase [Acidomonas methanolica]MCQ9154361.1 nucleoside 2-deoxyribosyltransferase [Acidomonas methanolica]
MNHTRPKIYLAGDLVFRRDALALFARLKTICAACGLEGLAPFDGQKEAMGLPPGRETILKIVAADRALMDGCDAGLFCIDPFRRSPEMDPGTAVEIGYMLALGKPLEAWTTDPRPYAEKVDHYWRAAWALPLAPRPPMRDAPASGALEDPDGMLVHSDGMLQNGMVEGFISFGGGVVSTAPACETAFRKAATRLAQRLGAG